VWPHTLIVEPSGQKLRRLSAEAICRNRKTDTALPHRKNDLSEHELPKFATSKTEMLPRMRISPITLNNDPSRTTLRMDADDARLNRLQIDIVCVAEVLSVSPIRTAALKDNEEPHVRNSKTEMADPSRANDRIDKLDPKTCSSANETLDPSLQWLQIERFEPSRPNVRNDNELVRQTQLIALT
jgi:hypothetical protein